MDTNGFSEDNVKRDDAGRFSHKAYDDAAGGMNALSPGEALGDELIRIAHAQAAEVAVGGPESMTAAKDALWRTVLWSERPEAYYLRDADGVLAGIVQNEDAANADYLNFDRDTWSLTPLDFIPGDVDPESKAQVEADFEAWVDENSDAVKAFVETVADPDGGDPAEFLAHNWWLTKNSHGAGFTDRLTEDPAYGEAVREAEERKRVLVDAVGSVRDNNARVKAGTIGAESDLIQADYELEKITGGAVSFEPKSAIGADGPADTWSARIHGEETVWATKGEAQRHLAEAALDRITPLNVLREKATPKETIRYEVLHSMPGLNSTSTMHFDANSDEEAIAHATEYGGKASIFRRTPTTYRNVVAERAVRRAEALTALDKATPTCEYEVYVGDDGKVYVS